MGRQSNAKRKRRSAPRRARERPHVGLGAIMGVVAVVGVGALLWFGSREPVAGRVRTGSTAPSFVLPSTDGRTVALEDLRGRNVLLYFNEGAGCGSCFTQLVELEPHLGHLGEMNTSLLPVSPNPASVTVAEAARYGVATPFLVDDTLEVATAYDTLGRGHHANLPGHSFVLVDGGGMVRWRGDYPGMWVTPSDLLNQIRSALAA